jgi:hypothetical protein
MEFVGKSEPLTGAGLAAAASDLKVKAPEVWTILTVETGGCGYLGDRRPPILFERHIFSQLTKGKFDKANPDIGNKEQGGYGAGGAAQYDKLTRAIALDRGAALQSASWGLGQVLGTNFKMAGFADVEAMVTAMCDSEDAQLLAVSGFLRSKKLDNALQAHDWTSLARGYNGKNFAENNYDTKLRGEFLKLSGGSLPDLTLRATQIYLIFLNFHPGPVDGLPGARTRDALAQFQKGAGIQPQTGLVDDATMAALRKAALG